MRAMPRSISPMLTTLRKQSSGRCLLTHATTPGSRCRSRSSESTIVSIRNTETPWVSAATVRSIHRPAASAATGR
ncbi:MAG: hypothetical protein ACK56I_35540 [bacterium]